MDLISKEKTIASADSLEINFGVFSEPLRGAVREIVSQQTTILSLPDNPTNGDVVKALWGIDDSDIDEGLSTTYVYTKVRVIKGSSQDYDRIIFSRDWWNSPYKGVTE